MSNGPPRMNLAKLSKASSSDGKYYHCTIHINTSWHEPTYMSDHCFALASVTSSYWHLRLEWIHQQVKADDASVSAMIDTLKNSMQSLIFGENGFNSIQHWFTAKNGPFLKKKEKKIKTGIH